jgi:hypothetical protein
VRYRHTQVGWIQLTVVGLVVVGAVFASTAGVPGRFVLGLDLLCVVLALFSTLTVTGDDRGLMARFGPGLIRKRFAWSEIHGVRRVRNHWLSGWGIRWIGTGWLYNVSGLDAIELALGDGRVARIGTDDPDRLLAFVGAELQRRP